MEARAGYNNHPSFAEVPLRSSSNINNGHAHSYSQSSNIPSSPSISNSNFPAGSHVSGYGHGQRGVKHGGGGMGLLGMSRHLQDDAASVSSLLMDRDGSYDKHSDDSHGHAGLGVGRMPYTYSTDSLVPPQFQGHPALRQKTSYSDLKGSDHKILSNEECVLLSRR